MNIFDDIKSVFRRSEEGVSQLIVINIAVFLAILLLQVIIRSYNEVLYYYIIGFLVLPADLSQLLFRPWTIITYAFVHENIWHIFGNMLSFYWFGSLITEYIGTRRLFGLYFWGSIVGAIAYLLMYNLLPAFKEAIPVSTLRGASAGIYAVIVGAATLIPHYSFRLILIGNVRIWIIASFMIVLSIASTVDKDNPGGNLAHLGGALIGYIFIRQLQNGRDMSKIVSSFLKFFKKFGKVTPELKITYRNETKTLTKTDVIETEIPNQTEIDRILDKINQTGYNSLSQQEKQRLFRASQEK